MASHRAAIVRALRGTGLGETGVETIANRREKRAAGLWGLVLGPIICVLGTLLGTVLMNAFVSAALRPGDRVLIPNWVLAIIFGIAFYGGLVMLTGTLRTLEVSCSVFAPPRRGAARVAVLALLALEGTALVVALVLVVYQIGIAEFLIG